MNKKYIAQVTTTGDRHYINLYDRRGRLLASRLVDGIKYRSTAREMLNDYYHGLIWDASIFSRSVNDDVLFLVHHYAN